MKALRHLLLVCMLLTFGTAAAQETLNATEALDGRWRNADYATETVIRGGQLDPYDLTLYHSLTVTRQPEVIRRLSDLVMADSRLAVEKEEKIKNGRINYGFYEFRPVGRGKPNRFVFFFSNSNKAVLIYMEGDTDIANIKRLIKKQ